MNKNLALFNKLKLNDSRKFKPGEYIVIADGKLFKKGMALEKFLAEARQKYPHETPFVAKVPQKAVFVFFL